MKSLGILVLNINQEKEYFMKLGKSARKKNYTLSIFHPKSIDFSNSTISGIYFSENMNWIKGTCPIPHFIYDRCFYPSIKIWEKYRETIRQLKKESIFIGNGLPGKLQVYEILALDPILSRYIPPTTELTDEKQLFATLSKHGSIILKPQTGSQGKGIFLIKEAEGFFHIKTNFLGNIHTKKLTKDEFNKWIAHWIATNYLIQPYLTLQREDKPFDIRVLLQKGENGSWFEQGRGIRVGARSALISNLHAGAKAVDYDTWLYTYFNTSKQKIDATLHHIINRIPTILEKHFYPLFEIGIDLSIDQSGHIWVLEVNSKPGHKIIKLLSKEKNHTIYETPYLYCNYLLSTQINKK